MIKKTKYILFFSSLFLQFAFCNLYFAFAQVSSLSPVLIGSTGNYSTNSFGSISSSVGEPMVTTVSAGSVTLTQGFQQSSILTPSVTIVANPATICAGSSTTLTASVGGASPPFVFSWSPASGLSCSSCSSTVATPTSTGITTYTVSVSVGTNVSTATVAVTVSPKPAVSISSTYNLTTICTGSPLYNPLNTTTLTATSSANNFLWSPGGKTTPTIKVGPTGVAGSTTYTVVVTNAAGCKGADTMRINVIPLHYNQPTINPSTAAYCANEPIQPDTVMNPAGGSSYIFWSNQTAAFVPLCTPCGNPYTPQTSVSASYFVVQGTAGCFSNPASVYVTINKSPTVTVSPSPNITICPGFTAQLTSTVGGDTTGLWYQWLMNSWDTVIPNSNSPSLSVIPPRDSTMYIVDALNTYGCWAKDTVTVFLGTGSNCELHVFNGLTPNGDGKNDEWWIDGIRGFPKNNVSIFNRWGENVWTGKNYDNDKIVWKGNDNNGIKLPSGTYYYVIELFSDNGNKRIAKWVELTR